MIQDSIDFANKTSAVTVSKDLYPTGNNFTLIDHGYDNIVVLVDKDYAIRFPRNANANLRCKYEKQILEGLAAINIVGTPHILAANDNPPYLVTSFVPGRHISSKEIGSWDVNSQENFAKKVADFAYAMHASFKVPKAKNIRKKLKLDELEEEPWDIYFTNRLLNYKLPVPTQNKLAKEYYEKWKNLQTITSQVVIHDDLHTDNMLFDENCHLIGVLDFGDTNIGTPEQELRQLYRINEHILTTAIKRYEQLSNETLNIEASKIWAIMQELATYAKHLMDNDTAHPAFTRTSNNLNKWLVEGKWGNGFTLSNNDTSQ